ncbi:MAG: chromosome segregation protein SMC, partial [Oscillospiraceae bacterium]|nr:chromosome segregation protein SMC [Oscillospiraceae bacterium]
MLLKALEIQGFKSFPDKTVLRFGDGITAVVGPNGSGKSNISDAIRWVLGEQSNKSLRGTKTEDVIFKGTARRGAVGFAEVSLVFDNTARKLDFDADDVKVTRRYYRSGDSEYLINNVAVRLKDVQLLFMDTGLGRDGYSIIGQGRISDIVESKSADRREIFEEAAGIARYRFRKTEAERRLGATEENLLRLRDILKELEERVGPLEQQAAKAKEFLAYAEEKKELEIGLWLYQMENSKNTLRELSAKLEMARTQYDSGTAAIAAIDEEIEALSGQANRLLADMDAVREEGARYEEEAAALDSQSAVLQNDCAHAGTRIVALKEELAHMQAGDEDIGALMQVELDKIEARRGAIGDTERQAAALTEEMTALVVSGDTITSQMDELAAQAAAYAVELSDVRVASVTAASSLEELERRTVEVKEHEAEARAQREAVTAELSEGGQALDACREKVTEGQNALSGMQLKAQTRQEKWEKAKEAADKLALDTEESRRRARILEDLENSMAGFSDSVKTVLKQGERGALRGLHGPVSHLVTPQAAYALAIETALGAAAQNIVVDSDADAQRAIAYLRDNKLGRATFLPIGEIKGQRLEEKGLLDKAGVVGLASELVECDKQYEQIVLNLLGRTVVTETLNDAVALARGNGYRFRVVTVDGQVVNAGGSLTGGSHVRGAGLMSRRNEIDALHKKTEELDAKAVAGKEEARRLQAELAAAGAELTGLQAELATAQEDRIRFEGEVKRLTEQADALAAAAESAAAEQEALAQRKEAFRAQAIEAAGRLEAISEKKTTVEKQIEETGGAAKEMTAQREALAEQLAQYKLAAVAYQKEIEAAEAAHAALQLRLQDAAARREQLAAQIGEQETLISDTQLKIEQTKAAAAALRAQADTAPRLAALTEQRTAMETKQTQLRQQTRDKAGELELAAREVAKLEARCESAQKETDELTQKLFDEYELTRSEAQEIAKPIESIPKATRRVGELRGKIRSLGSVNVDAIEEFKEVSERYTFLGAQVADVEVSKAELLKLIDDLSVQMKDIFLDRFTQINGHYQKVFTELFGGGKGELELTDPTDLLNTGIDIKVQLPGKAVLTLEALSGGEKSIVAISL